ncbi:MotE family protein [Pararhodospirillum photometricum]|uniref:Magnesium transporter MgtE intracellular domain-containing protein n=1 Tax=Pararhodospirillum photometricum DSM 122 TaxID=1150469 RepID=H6SME9_PARPM|nr:hypothetical protein [Pararhodospirillum photometricum]CCG06832.1 Putative uncharacterized protein [Pararhodospirillum photometricum DSM 122]
MRAMPRVRLLPILIFLAVLMLSVRLGAVWDGVERLRTVEVGQSSALAQAATTPAATPATPAPSAAPSSAAPSAPAASGSSAPAMQTAAVPPASPQDHPVLSARDNPSAFTQSEIDLLQRLSERRAQLEGQAHELDQREAMLRAAEGRIDRKIAEMKSLESSIQTLLREKDAQEQARIDMLVNIYKTMKPKDAAAIFDNMDLPLIVDIFMLMKERSSASILAAMNPAKAREVTSELARKRMPQEGLAPSQG